MAVADFDIVLLTQKKYVNPTIIDDYTQNILTEDHLLTQALQEKGLTVTRTYWDNEDFNWTGTQFAIFRATWDYFHRFDEFHRWLKKRSEQIQFINPYPIILWSMDKHYLAYLREKGINIPPSIFIEKNTATTLQDIYQLSGWSKVIIKPTIGGGARHTYLIDANTLSDHEQLFQELISSEAMIMQEFQTNILDRGEVSFMVFGGIYSHAVLKKARRGDFRVQDDFGGSLYPYQASDEEKEFVERVIAQCPEQPVYARVDVMWDNNNQLCLSELELIEPELWFRKDPHAANAMAQVVQHYTQKFY